MERARAAHFVQELDDRFSVVTAFLGKGMVQGEFVSGQFAVDLQSTGGKPEGGIEPMSTEQEADEPLQTEVVAFEVRQLVKENAAAFAGCPALDLA